VIIATYAENGGRIWDRVTPPKIDRWGPAHGFDSRRSPGVCG
jgi:hypothetical protein